MKIQSYIIVIVIMMSFACTEESQEPNDNIVKINENEGVINDEFMGVKYAVYANESKDIFAAYSTDRRGEVMNYTLSSDAFPNKLQDQQSNVWNVFGGGHSVEVEGARLDKVNFIVGYWFFFTSFFEEVYLYDVGKLSSHDLELDTEEWSVNTRYLFYGSFQDGIPSIDNPSFYSDVNKTVVDDPFFQSLPQEALVTVIQYNGHAKIYPHRILEYHEIVNDQIEDLNFSLSYCPLTATSRIWSRELDGGLTEFGVSGILFNNNLVLYDRMTNSFWSQILDKGIYGEFRDEKREKIRCMEMQLKDALRLDGEKQLMNTNTGFSYDYSAPLYESYRENEAIFYPLSNQNDIIHPKERVIGVIVDNKVKVYRFSDFSTPEANKNSG